MYREVTMIEFKEVLRLWQEQVPKKRIAARLGLDPKTVRRYLWAAEAAGFRAQQETLSDEQVRDVLLALQPGGGRPHGESWARCSEQREAIQRWLASGLRLTKIRKLLARQGVSICYPTLYRFAVEQLQFGRTAPTIPILDGDPGQELQVDTGWVGWLTLALLSQRRRFRAWIFTAVFSRYRFVGSARESVRAHRFGWFLHFVSFDEAAAVAVGMWKAAFCAAFQARRLRGACRSKYLYCALRALFPQRIVDSRAYF